MKKFFGGTFIESELLRKEGIYHPIKLEYYKIINEKKDNTFRYGLEVIKTDYYDNTVKVEKEELEEITNDETTIKDILNLLKENKVTPVGTQDVLKEILIKTCKL